MGGFPKLGVPFFGGGPYDKGSSVLGSMFGSSYLENLPHKDLAGKTSLGMVAKEHKELE